MQKRKPLSVMNDFVFKIVFGSEANTDILGNFLKAVLPLQKDEFVSLKIGNTFLNRETETDKMSILDVKVQTASGKLIDVEIQVARTRGVRKRIVYYSAGMLREQICKGDEYEELPQVICILITGFVLLPEEKDYFSEISLRHAESGKEFTDVLKYVILELPKLPEHEASRLWSWMKFIKSESEEDLMEVVKTNPELERPVQIVLKFSEDEELRDLAERRRIFQMDIASNMKGAFRDGKEEGEREGRKEGWNERDKQAREERWREKLEAARKLKTNGLSDAVIIESLNLSPEDVRWL